MCPNHSRHQFEFLVENNITLSEYENNACSVSVCVRVFVCVQYTSACGRSASVHVRLRVRERA